MSATGKMRGFTSLADRQARKTDARKLDDVRSPLAFLLGKSKLEKELQGLSLAPDIAPVAAGDVVLRGVPQAMAEQVSEIVLEVTPGPQDCADCDRPGGWVGDRVPIQRTEGE